MSERMRGSAAVKVAIVTGAVVAIGFVVFGVRRAHAPKIRLGAVIADPPSSLGEVSRAVREGATLAALDLNTEWDGAAEVELVFVDSGGSASSATERLDELHKKGVDFLFDIVGQNVLTGCGGQLRNDKMLLVAATEAGPQWSSLLGPNSFRIRRLETGEGPALASWARQLRCQHPAIVCSPSQAAEADAFMKEFRDIGPGRRVDVPEGDVPAAQVVERVASIAPDSVVLLVAAPQGAALVRALRHGGLKVPLLGSSALADPSFGKLAGADATGVLYVVAQPEPSTPRHAAIAERWARQFSHDATDAPPGVFSAYDAVQVLGRAVKAAGGPAVERVAARLRTQDYEGTTGYIVFDSNGDRRSGPVARFVVGESGQGVPCSNNGNVPLK